MAVLAGNLDPLLGALIPAGDLYSLHVQSYTTTGTFTSESIDTVTAVVGNPDFFEGSTLLPTAQLTISAFDDSQNTATLTPGAGINPTPGLFVPSFVLGYNPHTLLLSTLTSFNIAFGLDNNISQDISLALFSQQSLTPGTVITFTTGGSYTDSLNIVCYCAGTHIATPEGETRIEDLRPGDTVRTLFSGVAAVRWIGRRQVCCSRHPDPSKVWPVRVMAGAFANHAPQRDLWLSLDHSVFADDVLIPVKHLINGTTISQVPCNEVTYYHLELPEHDVVLADGLSAESYLDVGDRHKFEGGGGALMLHPDFSLLS